MQLGSVFSKSPVDVLSYFINLKNQKEEKKELKKTVGLMDEVDNLI